MSKDFFLMESSIFCSLPKYDTSVDKCTKLLLCFQRFLNSMNWARNEILKIPTKKDFEILWYGLCMCYKSK